MRAISILILLAVGCSGDKGATNCDTDCPDADAAADTDADTDTDPDTDTDTPAEDCGDGIDNDGDGLLDCEDGDCATDPLCLPEGDCADDMDNDGRTDCNDDDCWGNGCAVTVANLNSATHVGRNYHHYTRAYYGSPACAGTYDYFNYFRAIVGATGTVQHMPASTPVWSTCTWGVGQTYWSGSQSGGTMGYGVTRVGFHIQSGCALDNSDFLPQYLNFDDGASPTINIVSRPNGNGPRWASFNSLMDASSPTQTAYVTPGSPCSMAFKSASTYHLYTPVGSGSYTLAAP